MLHDTGMARRASCVPLLPVEAGRMLRQGSSHRLRHPLAFVAVLVAHSGPAFAQGPSSDSVAPEARTPAFGERGQWVILASSTSGSISYENFGSSAATVFDVDAAVGVDRFVARNFSLGIDLEVSYENQKLFGATSLNQTTDTHFAGGIRFGVNLPFGNLLSLYPRATLGIGSSHTDTTTISSFNEAGPIAPPSSSSTVVFRREPPDDWRFRFGGLHER
jgi:hypothetical protein